MTAPGSAPPRSLPIRRLTAPPTSSSSTPAAPRPGAARNFPRPTPAPLQPSTSPARGGSPALQECRMGSWRRSGAEKHGRSPPRRWRKHPRERSGEPVQTGLLKRGRRWDGNQQGRAVHIPLEVGVATDPAGAPALGRGHQLRRGVNQPDYVSPPAFRLVGRAPLHASVTRGTTSYGFDPHWVSIRLASEAGSACFPRAMIKSFNAADGRRERPVEDIRIVGRAWDGAVDRFYGKSQPARLRRSSPETLY